VLKPTGRNEVQSFFFPPRGTKEQVAKALYKALREKRASIQIGSAQLAYAPYWRVRGLLFQWAFGRKYAGGLYGTKSFDHFKKLRAVAYHRTFPAFSAAKWELFSLGLRAQVLKMWPYNKARMGKDALIVRQEIPLQEAVRKALQTPYPGMTDSDQKIDLFRNELIGESYSLIYFPFFCFSVDRGQNETLMIVDALSHKVVKGSLSLEKLAEDSKSQTIPYKPFDFIPFKCPNCGWDLPFRPHTKIHLCRTCGRAWQEIGGSYQEVAFKLASSGNGKHTGKWDYLPFWQLTVSIATPQKECRNLKDFYELFPLPRVMDQERLSKRPIRFYIPAFRIRNALAVDRFAAQLTRNQPLFEETEPEDFREVKAADVWLPLSEALEMAHVLLYSMTPKRAKRTHGLVKDAQLRLEEKRLLWMPFFEKGIFLREATTDFAIQKNCLELD
jgi:hypothetical protein